MPLKRGVEPQPQAPFTQRYLVQVSHSQASARGTYNLSGCLMTFCCKASEIERGYKSASICINKPAIMRPRIARLSISMCSSSV